ncbi:hypothetical protein JOF56_002050 [Kibdelosporangium banguiense]|uniref:Tat pathway signal protein n=1 Tax=Kibdelosporangium banguiense TaxID=1365924 RepID=A0ABS4TC80_9PSEU|nr:hypothetical protein [Kibdelosporangium banguiense]MBP2321665.1 hypothetical protein [Kibdelosporangium banguiense]
MTDSNDHPADDNGQEQPKQQPPKRGGMRFQDADTSVPREPTLAEKRAMRKALEEESEQERTLVAEAERKSLRKRRVMIGAGVTVGVVATVAVWYSAATPDEVSAYCVDDGNTLTTDENICSDDYVRSQGGYSSGGFFFIPIGGGQTRSYHYNYGGTVSNGRVSGGTTTAPSSGTTIKSSSGKTIQRGGFGVSGGGKSGGSGGSGGS